MTRPLERDAMPLPADVIEAEKKAKPPRNAADDGKTGGQVNRGDPGQGNFRGHDAAGTNAMTGQPGGDENERTAPGISTDKKADDTK